MADQITDTSGEIDEYADIGMDESAVRCASLAVQQQVFDTLGLKAISIRLPAGLIEAFKAIANLHGVGYQPLMRDALERFAVAEMKRLTIEYSKAHSKEEVVEPPELPPMAHAA